MKLHLRVRRFRGRTYRVLSLRPKTQAIFSNNLYHDTWHILTDVPGAHLLAHIFWGLSFQRELGTLFAIYGEHLQPNGFDAEPSKPILLIPSELTHLDLKTARALKGIFFSADKSDKSARLNSAGFDRDKKIEHHELSWKKERVRLLAGCICYFAPPKIMQVRAQGLSRMKACCQNNGMDYDYLDHQSRHSWAGGELQLFRDWRSMIKDAKEARRRVLARGEDFGSNQALQSAIWAEGAKIRTR